MARQRHTAEEIINKLREAEGGLTRGMAIREVWLADYRGNWWLEAWKLVLER